jgi:uncharacterized membrane protein
VGDATGRRRYLDWARGLAVLIMIQAHVLDSWTRLDVRGSWQYAWAMIVAGFGAPMFLFFAGVAVALSAGSKLRRTGDSRAAAYAVMNHGAWIFFLAFLFRIQAWALGWGPPRSLLKVDVLNIMGPSIVAAGALWGALKNRRQRLAAFTSSAVAIALLTPIVRGMSMLDGLPDPLEAYLRPLRGFSSFCLFPWSGFVFAGGVVGVLLDDVRTPERESRLNAWLALAAAALAVAAYAGSFLPSPSAHSEFWGGSPSFFAIRVGILTLVLPVAYLRERLVVRGSWSPMEQLGRSSFFIYWIHVEMVYGLLSLRIHKTLSHPQAWAAYVAFVILMLLCSIGKDQVVRWWNGRRNQNAYLIESRTF